MPILEWLNKGEATKITKKLPYRILKANADLSYGEQSENMIIKGDNLEALQALLPYYKGQIKCIYIDPHYNTRKAFESYDDNLEHSIWLKMMYPRLELLWQLLKDDGIILISINDDEMHYLKVICDEIFGRNNFISTLIWHYEGNTDNQAKIINYHEYILVYSKNGKIDNLNVIDPNISKDSKLFKDEIRNTIVKNGVKNPPSSVEIPKGFPTNFESGCILKDSVNYPKYNSDIYVEDWHTINDVTATTGWSSKNILVNFIQNKFNVVKDSKNQDTVFEITKTGAIECVKKRSKEKGHFVSVLRGFGTTHQMSQELEKLGLNFDYPKPVDLIAYLVEAFTNENDIILDSFAGSGTTACSVIKLNDRDKSSNRRFILVEMSQDSIQNVILPRLNNILKESVVKGYTFYNLGETIFDENGNINKQVDFKTLASHIWFTETKTSLTNYEKSPLLGIHNGIAYYLLFNGILGDKKPDGGNVLTQKVYDTLPQYDGKKVIYGEATRMNTEKLKANNIVFKQTPYDVKAR